MTPRPPARPTRPAAASGVLEVGAVVGDAFEILGQLGQSEVATSYLAARRDKPGRRHVALKLLDPDVSDFFSEFQPTLELAAACEHRNLSRLLDFGFHGQHPYVALDYVKGQTLNSAIERRQESRSQFLPRAALSLVTPVCHALTAAHQKLPHAALTPRNVYVERNGRVRVANLGFGWLNEQILAIKGKGAAADSPFVAPEVRDDPSAATPLSDIYGLGLITISLLAGRLPSLRSADRVAHKLLRAVPERLRELLEQAISSTAHERPKTATEFLERLNDGIEDLRDQMIEVALIESGVTEAITEEELARSADREEQTTPFSNLLDIADLPPAPAGGDDPAVWLLHRKGMDYGPYTAEQVREQLLEDVITEYTEIRNLDSGETCLLGESEEFDEFVKDYIPVREERRAREAERRAEVQRKVKRAGAAGIISAIVGLLGIVGLYIYYLEFVRPQPEAIPYASLFARLPSSFEAPDQTYIRIAADEDLIASLLDFDAEAEEPPPARRRHHRSSTPEDSGDSADEADEWAGDVIDFTGSGGGNRRLTTDQINQTIGRHAREIRWCLGQERVDNPYFSSLGTLTIRFRVRSNGRPVSVDMASGRYTDELRSCLVGAFRDMRFPEFDGLSMPVSFPIYIR